MTYLLVEVTVPRSPDLGVQTSPSAVQNLSPRSTGHLAERYRTSPRGTLSG
jgi:hypothetical protein